MVTKVKIALYGSDGYLISLAGYLSKKCRNILETRLYTNQEMLEKQLKKTGVDVLLVSEEQKDVMEEYKACIPQIVFLSEGSNGKEQAEYPVVFRYQSADDIVKEILSLAAENEKITYSTGIISKKAVEIICGYAPFGGGGVTEFLLERARQSAATEKVIYINLEEFHGLSHICTENNGKGGREKRERHYPGMSEVLFYLQRNKEKMLLKLKSIVYQKENLDYIFSVEDYRDLHSMKKEDIVSFLKILLEQTEYEVLVFDIGFLGDATLYLMEQCMELYMPKPKTETQISKERAFFENLVREKKETILKKRRWI